MTAPGKDPQAKSAPKKPAKARSKRVGPITEPEKNLVAAFVMDQPREMTPTQVTSLARTLRRSKEATQELIEQAKENFIGRAGRYADIHIEAAEAALASGTMGGADIAAKAAQWALENMASDGKRIIETEKKEAGGARIMIGIKVGGVDSPLPEIAIVPGVVGE